jgi:hypothetical protein
MVIASTSVGPQFFAFTFFFSLSLRPRDLQTKLNLHDIGITLQEITFHNVVLG